MEKLAVLNSVSLEMEETDSDDDHGPDVRSKKRPATAAMERTMAILVVVKCRLLAVKEEMTRLKPL